MVDRTPENVVWCLCGTLLPPDTISTTWCLSCPTPPWGYLQLFSRQDKLVQLCTSFTPFRSKEVQRDIMVTTSAVLSDYFMLGHV